MNYYSSNSGRTNPQPNDLKFRSEPHFYSNSSEFMKYMEKHTDQELEPTSTSVPTPASVPIPAPIPAPIPFPTYPGGYQLGNPNYRPSPWSMPRGVASTLNPNYNYLGLTRYPHYNTLFGSGVDGTSNTFNCHSYFGPNTTTETPDKKENVDNINIFGQPVNTEHTVDGTEFTNPNETVQDEVVPDGTSAESEFNGVNDNNNTYDYVEDVRDFDHVEEDHVEEDHVENDHGEDECEDEYVGDWKSEFIAIKQQDQLHCSVH